MLSQTVRNNLQVHLNFLEQDQKELEKLPINWDNINSISDLFCGVSVQLKDEKMWVKIEWDSVLGRCIRKNKLTLGLIEKPKDGFLIVTKQDAQNLVGRLCDDKLQERVRRQLVAFQILCT